MSQDEDTNTADVTFEVNEEALEFAYQLDRTGKTSLLPLLSDLVYIFEELDEEEPIERGELKSRLADSTSLRETDWDSLLDVLSDNGWIEANEGMHPGFVLGPEFLDEPSTSPTW